MAIRTIKPDIYYLPVNHWDRQMFDALVPLPHGTSYNSYVIKGSEKTVIVDTAEPELGELYFSMLDELKLDKVDYVICDHGEQDHSGLVPALIERYPDIKIVTNPKCKDLLMAFFHLPHERFIVIKDRETLSLGNKTLEFISAPWVHWPDTMFTYVQEDKVLFSTDFFGAHIADSQMYVADKCKVYDAAKRYYAQIMMPFRASVNVSLKKVETLDIEVIAPSHGQLYDEPQFIIDAYRDWAKDEVKNEVVIPFASMHGSTRKMVEYLTEKLMEKGIVVKPYNLEVADTGEVAMATVDAATIILASPATLVNVHPKAAYGAFLINSLRPKTKFAGFMGSYGWSPRTLETVMQDMMSNLKVELYDNVLVKGYPDEEGFKKIDALAEQIYNKHKELNLF